MTTRQTGILAAMATMVTATATHAAEDEGLLSTTLWAVGVGMPVAVGVLAIGIFAVTRKHRTIGYALLLISMLALLVGVSAMVLDYGRSQGP